MKGTRTNIDVGGVLHAGRELELREAVIVPEFASFRFAKPAAVALAIRRLGRGLEVKGTLEVEVEGDCARCLDPVRFPLRLEVDERFDSSDEREDPFAENNVLVGDELDHVDLVRQLIDSALPLVLLCDDACTGLCAECGRKQVASRPCQHPEK